MDCSGEPIIGIYQEPSGFYQEGRVSGNTLLHWDSENIITVETQGWASSVSQESCELQGGFWTPQDFCCRYKPHTFETGPILEFDLGQFTPPFRVVRELSQ